MIAARAIAGGLAGGVAWLAGMLALFGPAQALLANPELQSAKFLAVFGSIEPLPRIASAQWILPAGIFVIATIYSLVYRLVRGAFARDTLAVKGAKFGVAAWALMAPWFEFYLPWNAMWEPWPLVALELALWLGVMLLVGLAIAFAHEWKRA
ncbi:MAG: hypothetical protein ACKVU1_03455 [bacterium]